MGNASRRMKSDSGISGQGDGHLDCVKNLRYLDAVSEDYIEGECECSCHAEKREWYLSDFGPAPHKFLRINSRRLSE